MNKLLTHNDIHTFLKKRKTNNYTIETNNFTIKIKIKKFFFNIKKLQKEIDEIRPLPIAFICHKYTLKEWLSTLLLKLHNTSAL